MRRSLARRISVVEDGRDAMGIMKRVKNTTSPSSSHEYRLSHGKPEYSCCNFAAFL